MIATAAATDDAHGLLERLQSTAKYFAVTAHSAGAEALARKSR